MGVLFDFLFYVLILDGKLFKGEDESFFVFVWFGFSLVFGIG